MMFSLSSFNDKKQMHLDLLTNINNPKILTYKKLKRSIQFMTRQDKLTQPI